jgi:hypothetical protein
VVSTEDGHAIRVPQLEGHKESHGLDRVVPTINIVPHEEVVGVGRVSTDSEELGQIMLERVGLRMDGSMREWREMDDARIDRGCRRRR